MFSNFRTTGPEEALETLKALPKRGSASDRGADRIPCVVSALMKAEHDFAWMPVYIRDVNRHGGVGFVHGVKVERGWYSFAIHLDANSALMLHTEIYWCRTLDDHWCISGGEFESADLQTPSPWTHLAVKNVDAHQAVGLILRTAVEQRM